MNDKIYKQYLKDCRLFRVNPNDEELLKEYELDGDWALVRKAERNEISSLEILSHSSMK